MNTIQLIRNRIIQLCDERNITMNKLATLSGISPSSIKSVLYKKSNNPKILTIKLICDGLGISIFEFFNTPEFKEYNPEP